MTPSDSPCRHLTPAVFISHASEDKEKVARPLAEALKDRGVRVWYDEFVLEIGSSLRESIDEGLALSEFGIVILSPDFFKKRWTKRELNALVTRENEGERDLILPVWHEVDRQAVAEFSLLLADRFALLSSDGVETIADKIVLAVNRSNEPSESALPISLPKPSLRRSLLSQGEQSRIEWHPAVHELWGRSRLLWVCLAVASPSSQEDLVAGVGRTLDAVGSSAYAYDVVYGAYDGLLKTWVPAGTSKRTMFAALSQHLPDLASAHIFEVEGIARHWVWMSRDGQGVQLPDAHSLQDRPAPGVIRRASAGELQSGQLNLFLHQGLLARIAQTADAIGFFIAVQGSETRLLRHQLQSELERILDSAISIAEPALYHGHGLGDYAVTGRISYSDFDRLRMDVIIPVNRIVSSFGGRTQTTLTASSQSLLYRDEPARVA